MVPPGSDRVSPAPPYSGSSYGRTRLRVRGFHALRPGFPKWFPWHVLPDVAVLQPRLRLNADGLGSSAFARRYSRNHCCFLLLRVLRCFSSPGWPLYQVLRPFAPPRGFSQLVTSFVASESQGIPRTPFLDFLVSSFNCILSRTASRPRVLLTFDSWFFRILSNLSLFSHMS